MGVRGGVRRPGLEGWGLGEMYSGEVEVALQTLNIIYDLDAVIMSLLGIS